MLRAGQGLLAKHHKETSVIRMNFSRISRYSVKHRVLKATRQLSASSKSIPVSKKFPTHVIFGANTDVGKTVFSTSLVKSNVDNNQPVHYIKPLQCGGSDEGFVLKHMTKSVPNDSGAHTLFNWNTPASPHLASRIENQPTSDEMVLDTLQQKIRSIAQNAESVPCTNIWIETAGGVLSPSSSSPLNSQPKHASNQQRWGWSTQGDLYKQLQLPVVLVGDGRLGGISATLSAMESLIVRGYDIHALVLIDEAEGEHGSNLPALKEYAERSLSLRSGSGRPLLKHEDSIISLPPLPPLEVPLDEWFASAQVKEQSDRLNGYLNVMWNDHVDTLYNLRSEGKESLWWPFTQHQGHDDKKVNATVIDGATGDYFSILNDSDNDNDTTGMERSGTFDACASWWTQGMGHGETSLSLSAAAAAGKFGHVIFPDVVHEPAKALADRLLHSKSGPGRDWASRVFFTDDGSTAMEVAIKMGMKKYVYDRAARGDGDLPLDKKLTVVAQNDCYHGDTLGVMDVAEPSVFNEGQHPWYEPKGLFLSYPTIRYANGKIGVAPPSSSGCPASAKEFDNIESILDVEQRLFSDLYTHYYDQIDKEWLNYENTENKIIGSVVIEPVLLGAGGMKFIDPLWQRALIDLARSKHVPIIFDEVAAGLYRVGVASCREIIGANPDIAAYAKLLTGGLIPMSVTLASEDVFKTFLGDTKAEALLHGHSYTAHPVGCVSSIHALDTYAELFESNEIDYKTAFFNQEEVSALSELDIVQEAMSLGTVVAVTIEPDESGSGYAAAGRSIPVVKYLLDNGVYARPLGNVVYIMVSPLTKPDECSRLCGILKDALLTVS